MSLSIEIKELALKLGFCKAGITKTGDFSSLIEELTSEGIRHDCWINNQHSLAGGVKPKQLMPTAKSIIITAFDYAQKSKKLRPMIERSCLSSRMVNNDMYMPMLIEHDYLPGCMVNTDMYMPMMVSSDCLSKSYLPEPNLISGEKVRLLKEFLEEKGCKVNNDMYITINQSAARAGVSTAGKNIFAYVDGIDSFVVLNVFIIDQELEYDAAIAPASFKLRAG